MPPCPTRQRCTRARELISAATVFEASMVLESRLGEQGEVSWIFGSIGSTPRSWRSLPTIALAKLTSEPLPFKGNDFSETDIRAATENNRWHPAIGTHHDCGACDAHRTLAGSAVLYFHARNAALQASATNHAYFSAIALLRMEE